MSEIEESVFEDGLGFDGSSIRGWQAIHESDMLMVPDASTAFIDPFYQHPTIVFICDILDPVTDKPYSRDPRNVARKAEAHLKRTGIGDTAYFGPEAEFFVFGHARFSTGRTTASTSSTRSRRPGTPARRRRAGTSPTSPATSRATSRCRRPTRSRTSRAEMVLAMEGMGIRVEAHHHEVATAGQCEIDMRFDSLVAMADKLMKYKYVVRQVARKHGLVATFMPKPIFGDNGSGMHAHQSLWKGGKPLFAGNGYAGLSELGLHYIGGVLKHSRAIAAFTNPTTNSYKRLTPGFEAPVNLALSKRNRSACCRIPLYSENPTGEARRGPLPGSELQPLSGLRGDADGGARRGDEQDLARRPARRRHLRDVGARAGQDSHHAGQPRGSARRAGGGPRRSCSRATCSRAT